MLLAFVHLFDHSIYKLFLCGAENTLQDVKHLKKYLNIAFYIKLTTVYSLCLANFVRSQVYKIIHRMLDKVKHLSGKDGVLI